MNKDPNQVGQKWDKPYRKPVLRDRKGDLAKSWYVEYYYQNEEGQLTRAKISKLPSQPSPNRLKSYHQRRSEMLIIRDAVELLLQKGWTPGKSLTFEEVTGQPAPAPESPSVKAALQEVLAERKKEVALKTWKRYQTSCNAFFQFAPQDVLELPVDQCRRKHILRFFEKVKAKNATRNSYLTDLHTLFARLELKELIEKNPCAGIPKLKATVTGNLSYTHQQVQTLVKFTSKHYPDLLDFIRLVGYAFLRPSEILAIQVKHIDLERGQIFLPSENTKRRSKEVITIINQLRPTIARRIAGLPQDYYLFSYGGPPGPQGYANPTRIELFFEKARKVLQEQYPELHFSYDHKLYSIRHTFIQDLYQNFRQTMTRAEAEYALMPITRHKSLTALRKYVRDNALEVAPDWGAGYGLSLLE